MGTKDEAWENNRENIAKETPACGVMATAGVGCRLWLIPAEITLMSPWRLLP